MIQHMNVQKKRPSTSDEIGSMLSGAFGSVLSHYDKKERMGKEDEAAKKLGIDLSGIQDPETRRALMVEQLKGESANKQNMFKHFNELELEGETHKNKSSLEKEKSDYDFKLEEFKTKNKPIDKSQIENKKNKKTFENGLKTVEEMERIINTGNIGKGSGFLSPFNKDIRKDRAVYTQLGKSLISLASTIPIRNKVEFETLAEELYNPNNSDATNLGTLKAMKKIITQSMNIYDDDDEVPNGLKKPERPDLKSFIKG